MPNDGGDFSDLKTIADISDEGIEKAMKGLEDLKIPPEQKAQVMQLTALADGRARPAGELAYAKIEALEAFNQNGGDIARSHCTDDATHSGSLRER